jgi:NAD+ kinase
MVFKRIGLVAKINHTQISATLSTLIHFLESHALEIIIEQHSVSLLKKVAWPVLPLAQLGPACDLVIVIGGDGTLLNAARALVKAQVPVIGINRGRKGFLTDISPQVLKQELTPILAGNFLVEQRFLLAAELIRDEQPIQSGSALNDVVLYAGNLAKMIEFEVYINHTFVYRLRSDGLITATPTGSTAYALSGGGPILHPSLEAMVLVPMHPNTLSSRSIVVDSQANIELRLTSDNVLSPKISCDGQIYMDMQVDDRLMIRRHPQRLKLLHPKSYDYYHTLRSKLGWSNFN